MSWTEPYDEGRKAFIDGVPGHENPYGPGRALISFGSWAASWEQGGREAELAAKLNGEAK